MVMIVQCINNSARRSLSRKNFFPVLLDMSSSSLNYEEKVDFDTYIINSNYEKINPSGTNEEILFINERSKSLLSPITSSIAIADQGEFSFLLAIFKTSHCSSNSKVKREKDVQRTHFLFHRSLFFSSSSAKEVTIFRASKSKKKKKNIRLFSMKNSTLNCLKKTHTHTEPNVDVRYRILRHKSRLKADDSSVCEEYLKMRTSKLSEHHCTYSSSYAFCRNDE